MKTTPPWLQKLIDETPNRKAFEKALIGEVLPLWKEKHPDKKESWKLTRADVYTAMMTVLGGLSPADFEALEWKTFLYQVIQALGPSTNKGKTGKSRPFHHTTVRDLIKQVFENVYWLKIPPKLRQPRPLARCYQIGLKDL